MNKALKLEQVAIIKTYIDQQDGSELAAAKKYTDDEIEKVTGAATTLEGRVTTAEGNITTLIGDDASKSVRTIANEELAAQLIPEGAKEALDTLKEIADWIQKHPDDAAAMNSAIEALEALVGKIPEGATATTIVAYISEVVAAAQSAIDEEVAKKANKVTGATNGNFAGLNANGDLVDSGKKAADFDVAGAAAAVRGSTEETVASVDAKVKTINDTTIPATLQSAKDYADGLATNYDAAGAAAAVQGETSETVASVDAKVGTITGTTIPAAIQTAKDYADGLATNYDAAGAAAAVQGTTTETVASVDTKVSTLTNTTVPAAIQTAKDYADGLAGNYDAAGSASAVQGDTTATVKDVKDVVDSMGYATDDEVKTVLGLLPAAE